MAHDGTHSRRLLGLARQKGLLRPSDPAGIPQEERLGRDCAARGGRDAARPSGARDRWRCGGGHGCRRMTTAWPHESAALMALIAENARPSRDGLSHRRCRPVAGIERIGPAQSWSGACFMMPTAIAHDEPRAHKNLAQMRHRFVTGRISGGTVPRGFDPRH